MATVTFSCLKVSCFCVKAHLVFNWCLYNKNRSLHLIERFHIINVQIFCKLCTIFPSPEWAKKNMRNEQV